LHFAVALNRANLIECLLDKVDSNIESYAGKLAFEVEDDYDDDEDDDEIVCKCISFCYILIKVILKCLLQSEELVRTMNVFQLSNNSPIKC